MDGREDTLMKIYSVSFNVFGIFTVDSQRTKR